MTTPPPLPAVAGLRSLAARPRYVAAARVLAARRRTVESLEEAIAFAYSFRFLGVDIVPLQRPSEVGRLLERVEQARCRVVVEIGTGHGGTLFLLTQAATHDALLVGIDLPRGTYARPSSRLRPRLYRAFARGRQRIAFIQGDSQAASTATALGEILNGRELDFLFIDGDHRYEGVQRDFELYAPLVRAGGLVAFHDIVPGRGGVARFWDEVRSAYPSEEYVAEPSGEGMGIGVLTV